MIKKLIAILFLMYCMLILSGCNTIHGMGEDIQALGELIEEATQ